MACRGWRLVGVTILTSGMVRSAHPAFERLPEGGRAAAMGGTTVAVANDPWALWANPSLAASAMERSVSVAHSPRWLGIPELSLSAVTCIQPTGIGSFGLAGSRFGMNLYRETVLTAVFASTFEERFRFGCGITFYSLAIERYGTGWTLGVDAGFTYVVTPGITFGFSVLNINAPTIGSAKENLPQTFSVGLVHQPFTGMSLGLDVVKDTRFPMELHLGVEYEMFDCLSLRAGASDQPSTYTAGIGISHSFFSLDYGVTSHAELGFTHHVSLTIFPDML